MHPHHHGEFEEEDPRWERGWRPGPRARVRARGPFWFGPPWAGPGGEPPEAFGGPGNVMWARVGRRGGPAAGGRPWGRARRGDVRSATLALLSERPMHGYEIISELSQRTEGLWQPSPGSIYPTLQLLEDEGLIRAETDGEGSRRRFSLTDEGRRAASEVTAGPAPWEQFKAPAGARALRHTARSLFAVVGQVAMTGGPQEQDQAARILEEARRQLYGVLAAQQSSPQQASPQQSGPQQSGPQQSGPAGGEQQPDNPNWSS